MAMLTGAAPVLARAVASAEGAADRVTLDHEGRLVRRRRLVSDAGRAFMVAFESVTEMREGQAFVLDDGDRIAVRAAAEALLEVRGDLPRLAWHIGNRHAACRIEADRLLIRADPVLQGMLDALGAATTPLTAPFHPEGGAYGHGRTMGHHD